jgi:type IX secretion system PorP/SprF family membrane protein
MRSKNIAIAVVILSIGIAGNLAAQDIHFSQFTASPATLNPGATGAFDGEFRVVGNIREQWKNVGDFSTYAGSFDMPVMEDVITDGSLAFGVNFYSDKSGDLDFSTTLANLSVAANKSIDKKNNFSVGIQGGFGQRGVQGSADKQEWDNQYDLDYGFDPSLPNQEPGAIENFTFGDFSGGLLWRHESEKADFHAGASLFHLNQAKQKFLLANGKQFMEMAMHAGSHIKIKDQPVSFLPQVLFLKNSTQIETSAGMLVKMMLREGSKYADGNSETSIYVGGYYRMGDAAIAMLKMDYMNFSVGFSYDFNISTYKTVSSGKGGFELSIIYIKPWLITRKKKRSLL